VPDKWKLGDASSFAIDAQDNVWLLHRPRTLKGEQAAMAAPPVVVFDSAGNFIKAWGGAGNGYDWPEREHGIHIDHKGFVWIGGNNCPTSGLAGLKPVADDALLKFSTDGKLVMQIGRSNQSKGDADTGNVHRAADAWVHAPTNEVFVADGYGNHRVIVFDADSGAFKRMWGAFGKTARRRDSCAIVGPKASDAEGPAHYNIAHAIRVANDGTVYGRSENRGQIFTKGRHICETADQDRCAVRAESCPRIRSSSSCMSAPTRRLRSQTVKPSRSSGRSRPREFSEPATTSQPTRRATSISRRPRAGCRSWPSRGCRRRSGGKGQLPSSRP
jgi:hypothetical protein